MALDVQFRSLVSKRPEPGAIGGALEGADRLERETALWNASRLSPDRIINGAKEIADARGRDSVRNNGLVSGAAAVHKDSIIGAQFRLNAQPNWRFLSNYGAGFTSDWADKFQRDVEARFGLLAESSACWLDAERMNTFTGMLRLAIGVFLATGEIIGTAEWIRETARPYYTAIQFIRSDRLSNEGYAADDKNWRRGVFRDDRGQPRAYSIRTTQDIISYNGEDPMKWTIVPATKPWGRKQVIHIIEQQDHGQSRGIADMVAVLKNLRMTKRFTEIVLQNAVVNATYAAAIESELPGEAIAAAMGSGTATNATDGLLGVYDTYLNALAGYLKGSNNIGIDGAVIPHLFPGTKLAMKNMGTPGGIGTEFEISLLRRIAGGLGVSYEALSRDYSQTNYSSGRLATNQMSQFMASRKKHVADRFASEVYALWLEEAMSDGDIPLPARVKRDVFYAPLAKEAFCKATWIGSGGGQVDELKESQAAGLRIQMGLSTHEIECQRLGYDYREIIEQRSREIDEFEKAGVEVSYATKKPTGVNADDAGTDTVDNTPAPGGGSGP